MGEVLDAMLLNVTRNSTRFEENVTFGRNSRTSMIFYTNV
jgi:hypothetical protein